MKKARSPNLLRGLDGAGELRASPHCLLQDAWWRERVQREFVALAPGLGDSKDQGSAPWPPEEEAKPAKPAAGQLPARGGQCSLGRSGRRQQVHESYDHEGVMILTPGGGRRRPGTGSVPPGPIPGAARTFEHLDQNGGLIVSLGKQELAARRRAGFWSARGQEATAQVSAPPTRGRSKRYAMDHMGNMMQLMETKVPASARLRPASMA